MKNIKTAADSGGGEMHIVRATSGAGQRKKDQVTPWQEPDARSELTVYPSLEPEFYTPAFVVAGVNSHGPGAPPAAPRRLGRRELPPSTHSPGWGVGRNTSL